MSLEESRVEGTVTTTTSYNPANPGEIQSTTIVQRFDDGSYTENVTYANGSTVNSSYILNPDYNSSDPSSRPYLLVSRTGEQAPLAAFGTTLTDLSSLTQAIRAGDDVRITTSGLNLINNAANPRVEVSGGGTVQVVNNQTIFTTTTVVNAAGSVYSLHQAFGSGDVNDADRVLAVANSVVAVNTAANAVASAYSGAAGTVANAALDTVAGSVGQALPFVNIAYSIYREDYTSAAVAIAAMAYPVIGWIYAAYTIVSAITYEPPEAWAVGRLRFVVDQEQQTISLVTTNEDGSTITSNQIVIRDAANQTSLDTEAVVTGDAVGPARVQLLLQGAGTDPHAPDYFPGLLGYLNNLLDGYAQMYPELELGIVPQRLPSIEWHEARQSNPGYSIVDIDPLTGEARYPQLRYNDDFAPYNADPLDPEQRLDIFQRLVNSALERGAIAPMWEVQTARLQQNAGDPNAGLTEEERAARRGLGVASDADGNALPGQFRPIVLDLSGDGQTRELTRTQANVTFDWNDAGYLYETGWIGSEDGFLALDRSFEGGIESGRELFSNGMVGDDARGVRSLAWVDANGDGRIDAADPVFGQLRVWQDANSDARQAAGELRTLDELGITSIDYGMGRFTRDGQFYSMTSEAIEASTRGQLSVPVPGGIQVYHSDGTSMLSVIRVDTAEGGTGQGTNFVVRNDTIPLAWEDGTPPDQDGQQPAERQPISIAASVLLANDRLDGSTTGLSITSVGNALHGTVSYRATTETISFLPDLNYFGPASFEYTVTSSDGQTRVGVVGMNLQAVQDTATVTVTLGQRAVYGYAPLVRGQHEASGNGTTTSYVLGVTPGQGAPIYAPYGSVMGYVRTTTTDNLGETVLTVSTTLVDTGIPLDYYTSHFNTSEAQDIVFGQTGFTVPANPPQRIHNTPITYEQDNDGTVSATVDGSPTPVRIAIHEQGLYGRATVVAGSPNAFTYTGRRFVEQDLDGTEVNANADSDEHSRSEGENHEVDRFVVRVFDLSNPINTDADSANDVYTLQPVTVPHYGPNPNSNVANGGGKKPIAIDLDGDGFEFIGVDDSNVFLEVNGDGWRRRMAWVGRDDGLLVLDENGNGRVDTAAELSFTRFATGAQTDLEGLRAFDTNGDGVFSGSDDKWNLFRIWRDGNSNGVVDAGEMRSLADMGIAQVALSSDGRFRAVDGQTVHGVGAITRNDGTTLAMADVTLQYRNVAPATLPNGSAALVNLPTVSRGQQIRGTAAAELVFGTSGNDEYVMGAGNDVVNDDGGNDMVQGGDGDDTVLTGNDVDFVDGGRGNDTIFTGSGDDLAIGGSGDDVIFGEGGNDLVLGADGNDMISGGEGNDLLSGDDGNDRLFGEAGRDQLIGGAGDDELWGMDGDDQLFAGDGRDLLVGGMGDDRMEGGAGNDTYEVDAAGDAVVELANGGEDTVRSSVDYVLGADLENLTLTGDTALQGVGTAGRNVLVGNAAANQLRGLGGNDLLDGGTGADRLEGGEGDDVYRVDNAADEVVELQDQGTDTVESAVTHTLGANVENLRLVGIAAINATGNALSNVLEGNSANNALDGGAGADTMAGGGGNDRYVVDNAQDIVREDFDAGFDTVFVTGLGGYTLGANVDALVLGTGALVGIGNTLDNALTGNAQGNTLDGGAGADVMTGLAGDDAYYVDNSGDRVVETTNEGRDTVFSSVSHQLAVNVEVLRLQGGLDIDGAGNAGDNELFGNIGSNRLDGGLGADRMAGGAGNDRYVVDNVGDVVTEDVNAGHDAVSTSLAAYTLAANVEDGITTNAQGTALTGNDLANTLRGGAGNDTLDGAAGADQLLGGAGDDRYIVDAADTVTELIGEGVDTVDAALSLTLGANLENLVLRGASAVDGTGNELSNELTGNAAANVLRGMAGNDTLRALGGNDTLDGGTGGDAMHGGTGDDVYIVDSDQDRTIELAGEGADRVVASVDHALAANVEDLELQGLAVRGTGNELSNRITGNESANTLDGQRGVDRLVGLGGDDTYVVDESADIVIEAAGGGVDIVKASASYVLADNVENLTLTGIANIDGTGNALNNTIMGNAGANVINGGAGADSMAGGAGDDSYVVDIAGDVVTEAASEGFDRVSSSIDYVLPQHVERLDLTGTATRGTGNALNNLLFGNNQANILDGSLGADRMSGGAGDDRYLVDDAGDSVVEQANAGVDTVTASVSYALANDVENLILNGGALSATGNDLDNVLVGTGAANTITAAGGNDVIAGGVGDDSLNGGAGNDLYIYHQGHGRDVISDASGSDTLRFGLGITLDSISARTVTIDGQTRIVVSILDTTGQETTQGLVLVPNADGSSPIERIEFANGTSAAFAQAVIASRTLNGTVGNDTLTGDRSDDTVNAGNGADTVYGRWGNDALYGGNGADRLFGEGGNDRLYGGNEGDELWGGSGNDLLDGENGNDLLYGGTGNDNLLGGGNGNDVLVAGEGDDSLDAGNGDDDLFGDVGNDSMLGGSGNDVVAAGDGADTIDSSSGMDAVIAGAGDDIVVAGVDADGASEADFVDGGLGNDLIGTGSGNDFVAGGRGNDTVTAGTGNDIIAFNRGDGADVVVTTTAQTDTLSLGGGIRYADMSLARSGNNLVFSLGSGDSITFRDWYVDATHRNISTLQVVAAASGGDFVAGSTSRLTNSRVVGFDFTALVNRFDAARAANPGLTSWALAGQLDGTYQRGSNTQALGGDLAYRYGMTGSYGDLDGRAVIGRMSSVNGGTWQTLVASTTVNPWTALQAGITVFSDPTVGLPSPITPSATPTEEELVVIALNASPQPMTWRGTGTSMNRLM